MPAEFADIASYQAGADLTTYARSGPDRILIKVSQGASGNPNPYYADWWRTGGSNGLGRGAYHYATTGQTPNAEAANFLSKVQAVGGLGPRDWLCIDAESPSSPTLAHGAYIAAIVTALVGAGYTSGVIYSGVWWLRPAGLTAAMLPPDWRRLHLSDYSSTPDGSIGLPPGWSRDQVVARQYTSAASQPGIPGPSDRSRVLREWLPTLGGLVLDDPTANQILGLMKTALNGGTGIGQADWPSTNRMLLSLCQSLFNQNNALISAIGWNKGDLSLAARSDTISSEVGRMGDYLAAGGPLTTWLTEVGQQLGQLLEAVQALPVSTSGGDAGPVLAAIADLKVTVDSLTFSVVRPVNT
ncbi:GH25 family lysozyme [Frankia sp. AgW1.1]|uniref:GH25 family lysozyme n=1 Tax=Frankia sp. AgW1.1 TaxID=1836971 RepID=UPI001931A6C7|nr:GH25 family lysozyme [Frankia sp. AgW1.1]MBL7487067.1 hypothetical protein [Frankia sp. AgW1.1]